MKKPKDIQKLVGEKAKAYTKAKNHALRGIALAKEGKRKAAEDAERKAKYWWARFERD